LSVNMLLVLATIVVPPNFASANSQSGGTTKACATSIASVVAAHTRNWSQILLAPLSDDARGVHIGNLTPVSHRSGYNNQPAFSNDGAGVYYSWRPDNSEADIWYHEFKTGKEWAVTCMRQDEYSPALVPESGDISVVSLEDEGKRRLWKIPVHGGEPSPLFPSLTSVAYYAWANANTVILALTDVDKTQSMILAIGRVSAGLVERIGTGISQGLAKVPNSNAISYVAMREGQASRLMELDPASRKISVFIALPSDVEAYAWLPDGRIIAPRRSQILMWSPQGGSWKQIADLSAQIPNGISRLVVDKKGSRLLLVAPLK